MYRPTAADFYRGKQLRAARERNKWSRSRVVELFNGLQTGIVLHEMMLYRYEAGLTCPRNDLLAQLLKVLGMEQEALSSPLEVRPLRIGYYPFPDSILLRALLESDEGRPEDYQVPTFVSADWGGGPSQDVSSWDVTLMNSVLAQRLAKQGVVSIVPGATLFHYRGYSLLGSGNEWKSFQQWRFQEWEGNLGDTVQRVLCLTLLQVAAAGAEICVAAHTDMQEVLLWLVEQAKLGVRQPDEGVLLGILASHIANVTDTVADAFLRFDSCLKTNRPALYLGGASQSLLAEELGARTLLTQEEMKYIGRYSDAAGRQLIYPSNVLVARAGADVVDSGALDQIREAWNRNLFRVEHYHLLGMAYAHHLRTWLDDIGVELASRRSYNVQTELGRTHFPEVLIAEVVRPQSWA